MKRLLSLFLVFAFLLPCCALAEAGDSSAFDHSVDSLFKEYSTRCGEIVVARDGEIIYQRSYGWADAAKKTPVTPDHY